MIQPFNCLLSGISAIYIDIVIAMYRADTNFDEQNVHVHKMQKYPSYKQSQKINRAPHIIHNVAAEHHRYRPA